MRSNPRMRLYGGLAAGAVLAVAAPLLAVVGSLSGNSGNQRIAFDLGVASGNLGLHSGNVGVASGNVGLLSGNAGLSSYAFHVRGAAAYFFHRPSSGGFRVLYIQGNEYSFGYGQGSLIQSRYQWGTGEGVWAFYYECNVLQHGCAFAFFTGSGDVFEIDPTIEHAAVRGDLRNTRTGALCRFDVTWMGGEPEAGYWHYGSGDVHHLYEEAVADAYRDADARAAAACFQPFTSGFYAATYLDIGGYGYETQSLVPQD